MKAATALLVERLDQLGQISEEQGRLTRTFLSPAMHRANGVVGEWMRQAGLSVREDAVGNIIGRLEPTQPGIPKTLLFGSHLDTVRNAGRFDGALGVLLPIVALAWLRRRGRSLPFAVEIIGFSEEEAVRFPVAYIGSRGYLGKLRSSDLTVRDASGQSLNDALVARAGAHFQLPKPAHTAKELIGYIEVHIEQGPVLEAERLSVGVVSSIASQTRGQLVFRGQASHAGTTPMRLRHDALAGAAEFVLLVEKFACEHRPLVATVGLLNVPGGAANVVPGEAALSLDVRHPSDASCRQAVNRLVTQAKAIARRRGLRLVWQRTLQHGATPCSPKLTRALKRSVTKFQQRCPALVSGAGHDAAVLGEVAEMAMLFVRCRKGLSHHPDEYASPKDLGTALAVVTDFLEQMSLAAP